LSEVPRRTASEMFNQNQNRAKDLVRKVGFSFGGFSAPNPSGPDRPACRPRICRSAAS
jgi:hypothetical protein